jgi:hypothetical protein
MLVLKAIFVLIQIILFVIQIMYVIQSDLEKVILFNLMIIGLAILVNVM